jgi:serine protease Do
MRSGIIGIGTVLAAALMARADEPRWATDARLIEKSMQAVIAKAEPAVACVLVYRDTATSSEPQRPIPFVEQTARIAVPDYYGSGVVISSQGLILTNYHVVRGAKNIQVRLPAITDGNGVEGPPRGGQAEIFAADNRSDLAVLKLLSPTPPFPSIPLGRGEDLRKGSFVVSLAHPYAAGFRDGSASASWGIVSNLRRFPAGSGDEAVNASKALSQLGTLIQTDTRIQLGASGGALVDMGGRLVGLTTSQAALTGVDSPGGFAMPIDAIARRIIEVLLRGEEVEYGFLGVGPSGRYSPRSDGFEVGRIVANSPAAAKLQPYDIILKVNGQPVRDQDELFLQLGTTLTGRQATLWIRRGNSEQPEVVRLVKTPVSAPDKLEGIARQTDGRPRVIRLNSKQGGVATNRPPAIYGLRVDYSSVIAHDGPIAGGVVVREVKANSPAQKANLQEYLDIITRVNGEAVTTPAEFYATAQRAAAAGEKVTLTVSDGPTENPRTVTLP